MKTKDLLYGLDEWVLVQTHPKIFRAIYDYAHNPGKQHQYKVLDTVPNFLRNKTSAGLDRLTDDVETLIELLLLTQCVLPRFLDNLQTAINTYSTVNWKDGLSRFQIQSKVWAAVQLKEYNIGELYLCGGWIGTIGRIIFDYNKSTSNITSFDIDDTANKAGEILNRDIKYTAINKDIYDIDYSNADTIINTICEHIPNIYRWLDMIPTGKRLVLQNNNMFEMTDHINCVSDLKQFEEMVESRVDIKYSGCISFNKWSRYMIIGEKR
jgi:hypothetical protein